MLDPSDGDADGHARPHEDDDDEPVHGYSAGIPGIPEWPESELQVVRQGRLLDPWGVQRGEHILLGACQAVEAAFWGEASGRDPGRQPADDAGRRREEEE